MKSEPASCAVCASVGVYEPTSPTLIRVRSCVTEATWQQRVERARRDEVVIACERGYGRQSIETVPRSMSPSSTGAW